MPSKMKLDSSRLVEDHPFRPACTLVPSPNRDRLSESFRVSLGSRMSEVEP